MNQQTKGFKLTAKKSAHTAHTFCDKTSAFCLRTMYRRHRWGTEIVVLPSELRKVRLSLIRPTHARTKRAIVSTGKAMKKNGRTNKMFRTWINSMSFVPKNGIAEGIETRNIKMKTGSDLSPIDEEDGGRCPCLRR